MERGHRIGNHTFNHIRGFEYTAKNYLGNTEQAKIFMEMGGDINCNVEKVLYPLLFRPPHGHMFAGQYMKLKRHFKIVMWDLVTRDYSKKLRGPQVLANVMRYARNGSIITFHDSLKSWCNGNLQYALPRDVYKRQYCHQSVPATLPSPTRMRRKPKELRSILCFSLYIHLFTEAKVGLFLFIHFLFICKN